LKIDEIKLEVFGLVDRDNDALGARKTIIEKLTEKDEEVSNNFLSKVETIIDVNNVS
jgi:hypothetical protein